MESYYDDLNVLTDGEEDFTKLADTVIQFEDVSEAILSRDKKCKVLGVGIWSERNYWPLEWLKPVKSAKVFGIFIYF